MTLSKHSFGVTLIAMGAHFPLPEHDAATLTSMKNTIAQVGCCVIREALDKLGITWVRHSERDNSLRGDQLGVGWSPHSLS